MSDKKFVTLAVTHDQSVVAIVGGKCVKIAALKDLGTYESQVEAIKDLRRDGTNDDIAEVFKPFKLRDGYAFLTAAESKKRADALAKQQKQFEAHQKAEADKAAKVAPEK